VEQAQQSVARANSGSLHTRSLADGTRVFRLRFNAVGRRELMSLHERPGCDCGCGGGWDEPAARRELGDAIARVRLGAWKRPTAASRKRRAGTGTSFEEYALRWLQAKTDGLFGEIAPATAADYRRCVERHLLPIFGDCTVEEINRARCLRLKARLLSDARELREALAAGREMRDERGRRRRPLGPASVRKVVTALGAILDDAVEDDLIESNPARGKRMRVRVPKPNRTFLEMDELALLLDAAGIQDRLPQDMRLPQEPGLMTSRVADLLAQGYRPAQIARRLGCARSTVSFHLRLLGVEAGRGYAGRRVAVEILGRSGERAVRSADRPGASSWL